MQTIPRKIMTIPDKFARKRRTPGEEVREITKHAKGLARNREWTTNANPL